MRPKTKSGGAAIEVREFDLEVIFFLAIFPTTLLLVTFLSFHLISRLVRVEVSELVGVRGHLNGPQELFSLSLVVHLLDRNVVLLAPKENEE